MTAPSPRHRASPRDRMLAVVALAFAASLLGGLLGAALLAR